MSSEFRKLLITGGAGFVGSNLAIRFKQHFADIQVIAADNLKRRGSELSLARLREHGVEFHHADVRCSEDLAELPECDLLLDCSAEPSVHAGVGSSPRPVIESNLSGTVNCLELARRRSAAFLFLSTSRVYPFETINGLPFTESETRFEWQDAPVAGFSPAGIAENFPLTGPRSYYGATKLASELLVAEYVYNTSMPALINRCGVLTGPWQMGKVDQGVVALWVARHTYGVPLKYIGYGGQGKQVRDILHVDDLFDLLLIQLADAANWSGEVYNVGGGREVSVSLRELTQLCQEACDAKVDIATQPETSPVDIRIYLSDISKVRADYHWQPTRTPADIVNDIAAWIRDHRQALEPIFT